MRKLQKAAVAAAILGSFSFIATGTAAAYDHGHGGCKSHDQNIDILGEVGILNGLLGNALNGEGNAGGQNTHLGSSCHH
ncbi:hypothetical protein [Streptomyces regalis]|uniref:Chaplin domain-containing protein n=1 Tax=Streptomyces regalis TaxID=68262 RepID=A0A101J748_9ACTN|nr:hypothetical protein [Streptomyces regalis]KUL21306.1 hypothetical protein ADL12_45050 [Streptomyces regalis]